MTKNELIDMADKAGIIHPINVLAHLEVFAKLVAEKEREACAKIAENAWMAFPHASVSHDAIKPFPELKFAAEAIRTRGQA